MLKKYLHLCLFIGFSILLIAVLYYSEGPAGDQTRDQALDLARLIYSEEKDPTIGSEAIARLQPEPESLPQAQIDSSQTETASGQQPVATQSSTSLSQKEQQMVSYINEARKNAGLPALQVSSQLMAAARTKSKDMVDNNYFDHNSPTFGSLTGFLQYFGISFTTAAENIAMNSSGNVSEAHNSLMNSTGHRSNILGQSYSSVGVGIHVKSDGSHYYTQLFVGH